MTKPEQPKPPKKSLTGLRTGPRARAVLERTIAQRKAAKDAEPPVGEKEGKPPGSGKFGRGAGRERGDDAMAQRRPGNTRTRSEEAWRENREANGDRRRPRQDGDTRQEDPDRRPARSGGFRDDQSSRDGGRFQTERSPARGEKGPRDSEGFRSGRKTRDGSDSRAERPTRSQDGFRKERPAREDEGSRRERPAREADGFRKERPAREIDGSRQEHPRRTGQARHDDRRESGARPARSAEGHSGGWRDSAEAPDRARGAGESRPRSPKGFARDGAASSNQRTQQRADTEGRRRPWEQASKVPQADRFAAERADGVRVSKLMAERGLCSRREADEYIERGWVFANGARVTELGTRVPADTDITLSPKARSIQFERVTILLNKPIGFVSGQPEDDHLPAVSLVTAENQYRPDGGARFKPTNLKGLAPAGRLDIESTGLLVLTQDGRVARMLIGEDSKVEKEYLVRVEGRLDADGLALLNHGLELDGRPLHPAKVAWQNADQLRFTLREGRKRQIRRMCELVGLRVTGLKRIGIGRVKLGDLPLGQWRFLREDESFA